MNGRRSLAWKVIFVDCGGLAELESAPVKRGEDVDGACVENNGELVKLNSGLGWGISVFRASLELSGVSVFSVLLFSFSLSSFLSSTGWAPLGSPAVTVTEGTFSGALVVGSSTGFSGTNVHPSGSLKSGCAFETEPVASALTPEAAVKEPVGTFSGFPGCASTPP